MSKIALGRGLGSLIPQRPVVKNDDKKIAENSADFLSGPQSSSGESASRRVGAPFGNIESFINSIAIEKISKNPSQMRKAFDIDALRDLSESIKIHGILEPLLVSEIQAGVYELIAGERRLEAAKIAGLKKVPAIIREVTRQQKLELALIENIQRENLNPIEEARAYKMFVDDFGFTQEEIAKRSAKSRPRVANFLRLLTLPIEIQSAISENKISEGHGRAILALQNPEKQRALLAEILKNSLTVRQAEEKVKLVSVAGHTRKVGKRSSPWAETENLLSEALSARVQIKGAGDNIKIIFDCHKDDFDRVIDAMLKNSTRI